MKRIFLVFFILLFVLGCEGNNDSSAWDTGTDAIEFYFVTNNPPGRIKGDDINVAVEYFNKGIHVPGSLRFVLHGHDPAIMFNSREVSFTSPAIEAKTKYNPEGSHAYYAEWSSSINKPSGTGDFQQHLFVTACYDYKTTYSPGICLEPSADDFQEVSAGRCDSPITNAKGSQGAPLAITDIKHYMEGNTIYMDLTIENKGTGTPFVSSLSECTSLNKNDENTFTISARLSDGSFTCRPQETAGKVRLSNGRIIVNCYKTTNIGPYTTTPLEIELSYNYAQTIDRLVTIER